MKPQVTISLEEYEKLKHENRQLTEAFNKNSLAIGRIRMPVGLGNYNEEYSLINESEIIKVLFEELKNERERSDKAILDLIELKSKEIKKKYFW